MSKKSSPSPRELDNAVTVAAAPTTFTDFKVIKKLGEGTYSSVYHVRRKADNRSYALKKVQITQLNERERANAINEVRILASIKDPNVVSYKEVFVDPQLNALCIVMEHANNGDLFQKICKRKQSKEWFPERDIWHVLIQVLSGLRALHDFNVMHRDIKSANIFMNKDHTCKIGDMNVSKLADQHGLNYTQTGTPYYASPEVWKDQPYDFKSDIWSLGCVIYEMIALQPPFDADDMQGLCKCILKGQYKQLPKHYSKDLGNMIRVMLTVDARRRPSCSQLMSMPEFLGRAHHLHPRIPLLMQHQEMHTI